MLPRASLISFALAALSLIAVGCGSANGVVAIDTQSDGGADGAEAGTGAVSGAKDGAAAADAGATADAGDDGAGRLAPATQGSPLCNASVWMGCYPDDTKSATAQECNIAPDGGPYNPVAGYDSVGLGCHVERVSPDGGVGSVCTPPGMGADGAPCDEGTDCAPGLECVGGAAGGGGTCRHYCCGGSCSNPSEFCDIQTTNDTMLKVPVCMPVHFCNLLDSSGFGACPFGQTCTVARDTGTTSCVAIGPRQAGQDCNTDHCARDLACIGNAGARVCYALCQTGTKNSCPPGQTCMGGAPLFPTPGYGLCK